MALQFTKNEIEREIRDCLKHGDIREISIITGKSETYLASQLNPDDERESYTYLFLQFICAVDQIDRERGDKLWDLVENFRELSMRRQIGETNANTESGKLLSETKDFIEARLNGKDFLTQLNEIADIERQIKAAKTAVIDERNRQRFGEEVS